MVALERFGCDGNGAAVGRLANICGIGAGTVVLYTKRVISAIESLETQFIRWPSAEERRVTARRIEENTGFPNCIGIIDGTHIHFAQRPTVDPECYWTRKHKYSLNATIVCDDQRRIIYYQSGWPGSVFDNTCYNKTALVKNPDRFFSDDEYIMGDSAYQLSKRMLCPYKVHDLTTEDNQLFNIYFSKLRVTIEHVMGLLKSRWSSLRGIRTQFRKKEDLKFINSWIRYFNTSILFTILGVALFFII